MLINHRLSWLLGTQGFLFAAYGGLFTNLTNVIVKKDTCIKNICSVSTRIDTPCELLDAIDWALKVFPFLGVVSCLLLWWSIIAAQNVIDHILSKIDKFDNSDDYTNPYSCLYGDVEIYSYRHKFYMYWENVMKAKIEAKSVEKYLNELRLVGGSYLSSKTSSYFILDSSLMGHLAVWAVSPLIAVIWVFLGSQTMGDKPLAWIGLLVIKSLMICIGSGSTPFIRNIFPGWFIPLICAILDCIAIDLKYELVSFI